MHEAQPSNDECLIGTAVGVHLVHIGLAWAVAGVVAIYGGHWFVLALPAFGGVLWLASVPITRWMQAHKPTLSAPPEFTATPDHSVGQAV